MEIAFRLDVSTHVGLGHFKRCLNLAKAFPEHKITFLVKTDIENLTIPYPHQKFSWNNKLSDEKWDGNYDLVFVDFSHRFHYALEQETENYLLSLKKNNTKVILIDGIAPDALHHRFHQKCFDVLITPYFGAPEIEGNFIHLNSEKYFIVDPEEGQKATPIKINGQVNSILITTGGSDIARLSLRILKLFESQINYHGNLTIILGPGFESAYVEQLNEAAQRLKPKVELVSSPSSLGSYYQNSDICIATTGLTKYELALYGVPTILISPTNDLFMANKSFEQAKVAVDLGLAEKVSDQQLTKSILELIQNQTLRKELSEKSRRLIDGLGVLRLKKDLLEQI